MREGAGPRELFRFWLLRSLASGKEEEEGRACWGEVPLNAGCVVTGPAFEVPGTSLFH